MNLSFREMRQAIYFGTASRMYLSACLTYTLNEIC